jgi:hypothetical protein
LAEWTGRRPLASCRIKGAKRSGERRILTLACATSVAVDEVPARLEPLADGTLRRYLNDQDTTASCIGGSARPATEREPRAPYLAAGEPLSMMAPALLRRTSARGTLDLGTYAWFSVEAFRLGQESDGRRDGCPDVGAAGSIQHVAD